MRSSDTRAERAAGAAGVQLSSRGARVPAMSRAANGPGASRTARVEASTRPAHVPSAARAARVPTASRATRVLAVAVALLLAPGTAVSQGVSSGPADAADAPAPFPVVSTGELSEAGWSVRAEEAGRVVLERDGRALVFQVGNPFARRGDRVVALANAPVRAGGEVWLPREGLGELDAEAGEDRLVRRRTPWKVMVDPGHGGRDPGARGPRGAREKDVVLSVARKVAAKLREVPGIEPVLTREEDRFVPLAERSRMAVKAGADLFLSLHANAARDRSARGFETYFLGEARTEWARKVAMRENSAARYEDRDGASATEEVQVILANMDLNLFREESSYLAGTVQNALRRRVSAPDRGVKQNIFLVLANAGGSMPAVLVEIGFLSNPDSERRLRTDEGQEAVAEAVAEAVQRYFRERERRQGVQAASR